MSSSSNGTLRKMCYTLQAMMIQSNAGSMKIQSMIGFVLTQSKVMNRQFGVSIFTNYSFFAELDFDRTGNFMVSCGEDKNWMIWDINDISFENKGMISGLHSRPIYSCSWSKGQT